MPDVHIESAWATTEFASIAVASHVALQIAVRSGPTAVHERIAAITFSAILHSCESVPLACGNTIQDGHVRRATKDTHAHRECSQAVAGVVVATKTGPTIDTGIHYGW